MLHTVTLAAMRRGVSMAEVARRAQVSRMTVSRIVNRPETVAPATRARVEALMAPACDASRGNVALLHRRSVRFILCDRRLPGVRADLVLGDSVGGARRLTDHLLDLGYRRIALAGGNPAVSTARDRRAGFEQALAARGLPVDPTSVVELGYGVESGVQAVDQLLRRGVRFDAIVAANNAIATG